MSLLIVFGTRPEFLKAKPLIDELTNLGVDFHTIYTQEQKIDLGGYKPSMIFPVPTGGKNKFISNFSNIAFYMGDILADNKHVRFVVVIGDTATAFGSALAAMNSNIKIIHVEAGVRTNDTTNPFPEEHYRRLISKMAYMHFCATHENRELLQTEGIEDHVYVVGSTIVDTLVPFKQNVGLENIVLCKMNRRENYPLMDKWFKEINRLARIYDDYRFLMPLDMNDEVQKHREILSSVEIIEQLPHDEFVKVLARTKMVISDSATIQMECSYLNKKILVCRKTTDRPEALRLTSTLCSDPDTLVALFTLYNTNQERTFDCPYGDGTAAAEIATTLIRYIS